MLTKEDVEFILKFLKKNYRATVSRDFYFEDTYDAIIRKLEAMLNETNR